MDSESLSELLFNKPQGFLMLWQDHLPNLSASLRESLAGEDLKDVTLACDGQYMKAHKLVLSMCSPYLRTLFKVNPCQHPIIMLKNVRYKDLMAILQFMYQGEVNLQPEDLHGFLEAAEMLQIAGLSQDTNKDSKIQASPIKHDQSSCTVNEDKSVTPQTPRASPSVTPCKKMRTDNLQESEVDGKEFTNENITRKFAMPVTVEPVENHPNLSGENKLFFVKYSSREISEMPRHAHGAALSANIAQSSSPSPLPCQPGSDVMESAFANNLSVEDTDGNPDLPRASVHIKLPNLGSVNTPQPPAAGTLSICGLPDSDEQDMVGISTAATSKTSLLQSKSQTIPKVATLVHHSVTTAENSTAKNNSLSVSALETGRKLGIPVISRVVKQCKSGTHSLSSSMEHNVESSKSVNEALSAENDVHMESCVSCDVPIIANGEDTQSPSATVGKTESFSEKNGVDSLVSSDPTLQNRSEVTEPSCISDAVMEEADIPNAENVPSVSQQQPSSVYSFASYTLRNRECKKYPRKGRPGSQVDRDVKTFPCDKCDKAYTKRRNLQFHIRMYHSGPYKCTVCGFIKQRPTDLVYHIKIKHHVKKHFHRYMNKAEAFAAQDKEF